MLVIVGAILLRRLIGPNAALDRAEQIVGMLVALVGHGDQRRLRDDLHARGRVIEWSEAVTFCRTWWLGDTAGGLIALPLILTWARDPRAPAGACAPGEACSSPRSSS